jgi:Fusaric acid resistance protein-like
MTAISLRLRPGLPLGAVGRVMSASPRQGVAIVRHQAQPKAALVGRLTAIAVLAYLFASLVPGSSRPVLAPLTALLVFQATLSRTVRSAVERVAAVALGVLVASGLSAMIGFHWWSLAITIAAALAIGSVLRLGEAALEVPISAMLILSIVDHTSAATARVTDTLIGAGAGLIGGLILSPVRTQSAKEAIDDLSRQLADVLGLIASGVAEGSARDQADHWLSRARELGREIERVDRALAEAEDSVRLNPRTLGLPPATPPLRGGLEMLEHASVIIRGLARCIADESRLHGDESTALRADTRENLADALRQFAAALRAHGRLVWTEGASDHLLAEAGLESQLAEAGQALDRLNGALLATPAAQPAAWPLRGELLVHLDRLRQELEVEDLADGGRDVRWRVGRAGPAPRGKIPAVASSVRPVADMVRPVASRVRSARPSRALDRSLAGRRQAGTDRNKRPGHGRSRAR